MVDKASSLPVYFKTYPGNIHDSKLFHTLIDEIFGYLAGLSKQKEKNHPLSIPFRLSTIFKDK
ncbi:MAG: hypothetical protein ACMUIU_13525 [bacterium]